MDLFVTLIIVFVIFFLFSLCGWCCRKKRTEGAIFSSPVIITQTQYQPNVGPYPVTVQGGGQMGGMQQPQQSMHPGAYPMPQPVAGGYPPMPQPGTGGYPMTQPGPGAYPPYPVAGSGMAAPYPPVQAAPTMQPPSYDQVVGGEAYQKQSPFNPNYSG